MKKVFLLLMVLLIAVSLAACGNTGNQNGTDNPSANDDFDTSKVTLTSAYAKAQSLGFEGTLDEFIELISGNDGKDGKDGANGVGITSLLIDNNGDLIVVLTDGKTINCGKVKGADGKDGVDGAPGKDGADGKTPYIQDGYWYIDGVNTGIKAEGVDGTNGTNGKDGVTPTISISEDGYWVINGIKTEHKAVGTDGNNGQDGAPGEDGITPIFKIESGELFVSYDNGNTWSSLGNVQGADGTNGTDGKDGADGTDGKDGINGEDGKDGINGADGITPTFKIENGELKVSYDNGNTWSSLGNIQGADGKDGTPGEDGKDGVNGNDGKDGINGEDGKDGIDGEDGKDGITPTFKIEDGELLVSYDNGATWSSLGNVQGADGEDGKDGAPGQNGTDGKPGEDGKTPTIEISEDGYWVINGVKSDVKAEAVNGDKGDKGDTGATIEKVEFDEEGRLVITLTDGTVLDPIELPKKEEHIHTFGDWKRHDYGQTVSCDLVLSYRICSECYCMEWREGKYEDHNFVIVTTPSTCQSGGYDTKTCTLCGKIEICNETPISDHIYHEEYLNDNSYHWQECVNCDYLSKKIEHTLADDGICTICDAVIGDTEGLIYELSEDGTYAIVVAYKGTATRIRIAEEYMGVPITTIGTQAFSENKTIASVVIPNSIIDIKDEAFYNCENILSVTFGNNITSIGNNAFAYCKNITDFIIGDSLTNIGDYAFSNCKSITSFYISKNITSIPNYAFSGCTNLSNIIIPNGVKKIGKGAFSGCSSLESVTIPDSVTTIDQWAFNGCNDALFTEYAYGRYVGDENNPYTALIELTNLNLSTYKINEQTKIIAYNVFNGYNGRLAYFTSIDIPDSVISISDDAFSYCAKLTNVDLGKNVTNIGFGAFAYCPSLSSIIIPENVTKICSSVFWCSGLTSIVIPNSVTFIGSSAFFYCNDLAVYYTGTKSEWNAIGIDSDNYELNNATRYYYSENHPTEEGNFWHWVDGEPVIWCYVPEILEAVPPTCTETGLAVGIHCSGCRSILVAQEIVDALGHTEVVDAAVDPTCTKTGLTEGKHCSVCGEVTVEQQIVNAVGHILESNKCKNCDYKYSVGLAYVDYYGGDECYVRGLGSCTDTNVVIPTFSPNGARVISIGNYAFENCTSLTSIEIPDGVTSIGEYAFAGCTSLTGIEIPDSVTEIGAYAFSGCTSLTSIEIPDSVTYIYKYAFADCTSLESIDLPDNLTYIGESALYNTAYYNDECNWEYSVLYIGNNLIQAKLDLSGEYTIKSGTITIAHSAFYGCELLTRINIPESVTHIGTYAFYGCVSLTSIQIPKSVTSIGSYVFSKCTSLTDVYYTGSKEDWEAISFGLYDTSLKNTTMHYNYVPEE